MHKYGVFWISSKVLKGKKSGTETYVFNEFKFKILNVQSHLNERINVRGNEHFRIQLELTLHFHLCNN